MRQAHSGFREALLALSEEPTYPNVVRYLAASRALEQSRFARRASLSVKAS